MIQLPSGGIKVANGAAAGVAYEDSRSGSLPEGRRVASLAHLSTLGRFSGSTRDYFKLTNRVAFGDLDVVVDFALRHTSAGFKPGLTHEVPSVSTSASRLFAAPATSSVQATPAEELLRELGASSAAVDAVEWLGVHGLVDAVLSVLRNAKMFMPTLAVSIRRGERFLDLEEVVVELVGREEPTELYELKSRFDREWWLRQDASIRSRIGVYLA